jgi:1-acyl-sn-glycerol-3-phosphate acyltransferase
MSTAPIPGFPRRGNACSRWLGRALLGLAGWRIDGVFPALPKFVLIVAPHTSNWDFFIGIAGMLATGLRANWLGKHTIFRFPLTPVLRWLGGEPVDRSAPQGIVASAIAHFRSRPQWVLALSPEGTRRRTTEWKHGFLRIATGAGVPVVPVWFDYRSCTIGIGAPVRPSGDEAGDIARLRALFDTEMARHPELYVE